MKISLDTNAILDFCYRYYPERTFSNLWALLQSYKSSGQITFYACQCVVAEVKQYILNYDLDAYVFDDFIQRFQVKVIDFKHYQEHSLGLQKALIIYPIAQNSYHIKQQDYADLSIIALAQKENATVITSEQKAPSLDWNKKHQNQMKVPNVCEKVNIPCGNWNFLFQHLGLSI